MNDVVLNKSQIIERCIRRIQEEYEGTFDNLLNYTKQDSIILNIQRACEAAIDLAMYVVALKKIGVPQHSRDAFDLLYKDNLIDKQMRDALSAMVGFRNIAVHNYQEVEIEIIQKIIEHHLADIVAFKSKIVSLS
ncbi:DUF86 domain-containing protein [Fodinisporobacter ferrooxydans]|uniref:DUF86 domain-containing protein n=1 Tax=Fodinisporobacter ferrooxydans TaxID=2901836 RepID=A0ABY4CKQ9_9BACL|nr:DUF86 domain-containing protein [Alicyclobacillaceae bacterium MYW30-H2]